MRRMANRTEQIQQELDGLRDKRRRRLETLMSPAQIERVLAEQTLSPDLQRAAVSSLARVIARRNLETRMTPIV